MASFVVDGLTIPVAIAGHPALDFCNTRAGWDSPTPKEYLQTRAHLTIWARENDLIPATAGDTRPVADDVVSRAIAFRSALYAVLLDRTDPDGPADDGPADDGPWAVLDREVRTAAAAGRLVPGRPATWVIADKSRFDLPLLAVAWSAWGLLTSPAIDQVNACPGAGCGWLFTNPHGRRRWCSMAWCGNRDKVRRHAERTRRPSE